jgi:hypothetical protein
MKPKFEQLVLWPAPEQKKKKSSQRQKTSAPHSESSKKYLLNGFGKCCNPYGDGFDPNAYHTAGADPEVLKKLGYVDLYSFNVDKEYAIPDECLPGEKRTPDYINGEALLMEKDKPIKLANDPMPSTDSKKESKTRHAPVHYNRYGRKKGSGGVA